MSTLRQFRLDVHQTSDVRLQKKYTKSVPGRGLGSIAVMHDEQMPLEGGVPTLKNVEAAPLFHLIDTSRDAFVQQPHAFTFERASAVSAAF